MEGDRHDRLRSFGLLGAILLHMFRKPGKVLREGLLGKGEERDGGHQHSRASRGLSPRGDRLLQGSLFLLEAQPVYERKERQARGKSVAKTP